MFLLLQVDKNRFSAGSKPRDQDNNHDRDITKCSLEAVGDGRGLLMSDCHNVECRTRLSNGIREAKLGVARLLRARGTPRGRTQGVPITTGTNRLMFSVASCVPYSLPSFTLRCPEKVQVSVI